MVRTGPRASSQTVDLTTQALRYVTTAPTRGLELRMLGSTAVALRCTGANALLKRHSLEPKDIDLAALGHQRHGVRQFFFGQGLGSPGGGVITPYMDRDVFAAKRRDGQLRVEVFYDELAFVHRIDFSSDFGRAFPTLPIETLLMSKLQMRRRALSDWIHLAALLIQVVADEADGQPLDANRIASQAQRDYRCWRDFQSALLSLSAPEMVDQLRLTEEETTALRHGAQRAQDAIALARHGPGWILGFVKASIGLEPHEPEVSDYWEAG